MGSYILVNKEFKVTVLIPKLERKIAENYLNLRKATDVQDVQRASNKMNHRKATTRHITVKVAKCSDKEKVLKTAIEKKQLHRRETL